MAGFDLGVKDHQNVSWSVGASAEPHINQNNGFGKDGAGRSLHQNAHGFSFVEMTGLSPMSDAERSSAKIGVIAPGVPVVSEHQNVSLSVGEYAEPQIGQESGFSIVKYPDADGGISNTPDIPCLQDGCHVNTLFSEHGLTAAKIGVISPDADGGVSYEVEHVFGDSEHGRTADGMGISRIVIREVTPAGVSGYADGGTSYKFANPCSVNGFCGNVSLFGAPDSMTIFPGVPVVSDGVVFKHNVGQDGFGKDGAGRSPHQNVHGFDFERMLDGMTAMHQNVTLYSPPSSEPEWVSAAKGIGGVVVGGAVVVGAAYLLGTQLAGATLVNGLKLAL